jgi:hypothetical protein
MNSKKCLECGNDLNNQNNKFCNKSCATKYNNKIYPKKNKEIKNCLYCGNILEKNINRFCDIKCYNNFQYENKTLTKFYAGKVYQNVTLRKILIKLHGENCVECGCGNEWNDKPLTLEVDHIDGNSDNCMPDNLRLICPNCHSQQITNKGGINNIKETKRNIYLRKYKNYIG